MTDATAPDGDRASRRRRRWRIALLSALIAVVVLTTAVTLGGWLYGRSLDHNVKRTDVFAGLPDNRPRDVVQGAMNVLLMGTDSRDPAGGGNARSDTLMLLHLTADHDHAYVISIPRDTWVSVPPLTGANGGGGSDPAGGTMAKINAAYAWGGAPLAVRTVEKYTGVRIDHVVLIDFAGFQQVVDALGGIDMQVDQTITSRFPPHRVFTAGTHHVTGAEALDYVRQRYQYPDGDFTRERHQQEFLKDLMDRAANQGWLTDPVKLNGFLQAVTRSVTVDSGFDLVGAGLQMRGLRASDLTFLTSPSTGTTWIGDQNVVMPDTARAASLYRAVADDSVAQWLAVNPTPSLIPGD
ncbi:MAG TPA: LCP family protein [Micromonosporaceae bacterium]